LETNYKGRKNSQLFYFLAGFNSKAGNSFGKNTEHFGIKTATDLQSKEINNTAYVWDQMYS
jgi:hypothetical protein